MKTYNISLTVKRHSELINIVRYNFIRDKILCLALGGEAEQGGGTQIGPK